MTKSLYKTAQGKSIDMCALRLQNDKVRAVGTRKVNARGDVVDDRGGVVNSKTAQVNRQYNRTHKKSP